MMDVLDRVVALRVTAEECEVVQGSSVLPVAGGVDCPLCVVAETLLVHISSVCLQGHNGVKARAVTSDIYLPDTK